MSPETQKTWNTWADNRITKSLTAFAEVLGREVVGLAKVQAEKREAAIAAAKAEMRSEMGRFRQQVREEAAAAMAEHIARLERKIEQLTRPSA